MSRVKPGWSLRCISCETVHADEPGDFACSKCGDLLEFTRNNGITLTQLLSGSERLGVWRYAKALPVDAANRVTIGEGGTPLIRSVAIGKSRKLKALYFKNEGQNPSGSFKDRGMTVAVTKAIAVGASILICASTGNTSASLAAYAARAGLRSVVLLPGTRVASGKLIQAVVHGARILRVEGDFDEALELVREVASADGSLYLVNSVNPYRVEGQKTTSFEIFEQLGRRVPDFVVMPVGNAGNIGAIWKGFEEMRTWGIAKKLPRMVGVQASGAAPIVEAIAKGRESVVSWPEPSTIASAIRIGNPASWKKAVRAIRKSGGTAISVDDGEITKARSEIASREGIFLEPASAAPVAALTQLSDVVAPDDVIVCIGTGSGLKDPDTVKVDLAGVPVVKDAASLKGALR